MWILENRNSISDADWKEFRNWFNGEFSFEDSDYILNLEDEIDDMNAEREELMAQIKTLKGEQR